MDTSTKKRLCWNCEASVSKTIANCPYCGVYLHRASDDDDDYVEESISETEEETTDEPSAHLTPIAPYQPDSLLKETNQPHSPPYVHTSSEIPPTLSKEDPGEPPVHENTTTMKYALVSLVSLILGVVALLFSFILLFFSHHGVLTLRWSSELWYLYLLISIPLLLIGWFSLKHIKD